MPDPRLLSPREGSEQVNREPPTSAPIASSNHSFQSISEPAQTQTHRNTASSSRLPRVLLTGFSVFPGAPLNPTEHIIPSIKSKYDSGRYSGNCSSLITEVFPVEYGSLASRLSVLTDTATTSAGTPDIIIHLGLYRAAKGITLERLARNSCAGHPDVLGQCVSGKIDDGPNTLPSTLPLERIYAELDDKGIPVHWSEDAGGYMCNYIFRLSAFRDKVKGGEGMIGFVHVPQVLEDGMGMELGRMEQAVEVILEVCCKAWIEARGV